MRNRYLVLMIVMLLAFGVVLGAAGCGGDEEETTTTEEEATTDTTEGEDETTTTVSEEPSGEPIKIGAILSLTGPYAGLGEPEQNTIEMLQERVNSNGGVAGRPIDVIIEDDATKAEQTVAAATSLIDREGVPVIVGATGTGQTMAMRDQMVQAEIPNVSLGGGTVITGNFNEWVFQTPWSNTIVVPFTLDYIQNQGISKIAVIADSGGFAQDGVSVMKDFLPDYDLEVVAEETFDPGDTDMSAQLTSIKGTDAEAVVLWSAGSGAAVVAKNMESLEMDIPLFGSHGNARKEFIDGAGSAAEGFKFAAGKVLVPEAYGEGSEGYEVATQFISDYKAEYGERPNTFAGHAYDGLMITVEAMRRLDGEFTGPELRDEIEATSGFVGIGGTFTYGPDDHNGMTTKDLVMYEVKDGDWVLAE